MAAHCWRAARWYLALPLVLQDKLCKALTLLLELQAARLLLAQLHKHREAQLVRAILTSPNTTDHLNHRLNRRGATDTCGMGQMLKEEGKKQASAG